MKCYVCNGRGYFPVSNIAAKICPQCNGTGEIVTNDEWRKTCSTEDFAEWISNLAYACMRCGMSNGEAYCHTGHCIQDEADAVEWLKEKHNEM